MVFLTLSLILALPLSACAEGGVFYDCAFVLYGEERFEPFEVWPGGCSLELFESGEACLVMDGSPLSCLWRSDDSVFTLELGGREYSGSLSKGAISLELGGMKCVFLSGGSAYEPEEGEGDKAAESGGLALWNGDWYGLWRVKDAYGDWLALEGQCYDAFARIFVSDSGVGTLSLWDERLSASEPMAGLELEIVGASDSVMGAAMVTGGWFWQMDTAGALWGMGSNVNGFEGLIALENVRYDSAGGGFTLTLLLRPWGTLWDDVESVDPNSLPDNYRSFYLPLVMNGSPMPDSFDMSLLPGSEAGSD